MTADVDNTPRKTRLSPRWQPGQSGNPSGRPPGARSKLGESFLKALANDFEANGLDTITKVRIEKPDAYLRTIAAVLPAAKSRAIILDLPELKTAADGMEALNNIFGSLSRGEITIDEAQGLASLVETHRKTVETVNHEERLRKLEEGYHK